METLNPTKTLVLSLLLVAAAAGCFKAPEETVVVPPGTTFVAALDGALATTSNRSGDSFEATVRDAIRVEDRVVVPAGSKIRGQLSGVEESGRVEGRARMTLHFREVVAADGKSHPLQTKPIVLQAASEKKSDAEKIVGGGIAGAIIGGIARGGKGAAIGTLIGAGAGTAVVLATKGDDIALPAGQTFRVELLEPVELVVAKQSAPRDEG